MVASIVGVCNCSMLCCTLLYAHSCFAIILMGKRELAALLSLSSWSFVMVVWLFLAVPWVCLRLVIVVFPDHTHFTKFVNHLTEEVGADCLIYSYFNMNASSSWCRWWVYDLRLCLFLVILVCFVVFLGGFLWLFFTGHINPFMPNVFSHPYQLDESISNFRVVGWGFLFEF